MHQSSAKERGLSEPLRSKPLHKWERRLCLLLLCDEGFEGRPCRALSYLLCLTQGLVALAGLRTLGFEWIAPLGLVRARVAHEGKDEVGLTCTALHEADTAGHKKGRGYRSPSVRREHGSRGAQLIKRKKLS